ARVMAVGPLFAVLIAMACLGERPTPLLLLGAAAIVGGGVLLALRSRHEMHWRRRDMIFPALGALGFAFRDNLSRWGLRDFGAALAASSPPLRSSSPASRWSSAVARDFSV